jgi:AraC family transcriptional regulator
MPARDAPWLREPRGPLFRGARVTIGRFRRHPSEPDFADGGPLEGAHVVFPRLAVRIAQAGRREVVADSTVAVLYNPGQEYRRAAISPEGDRCDWFEFQAADLAAALHSDAEQPFTQPCRPAPMAVVLRARLLHARAAALEEPLALEEEAFGLLRALFEAREPRQTPAAWRELAEAAKERLARRFTERLTLTHLAEGLSCSPFHLCRAFSAAAGTTLHQHLTALRLHASLELIPGRRRGLSGLALELGFSSHAHFTAAFRRACGLTPSAWAARLSRCARTR